MLKVAICNDDAFSLSCLEAYIKRYAVKQNENIKIYKYMSAFLLLDTLNYDYDAFFLNATNSVLDGMDIAKIIRKVDANAYICVFSSLNKHFYEGYRIGINGFIRKPIGYHDIELELKRILESVKLREKKIVIIQNGELLGKIYLSDIIYVETANRKILIHTKKEDYYDNRKIGDFEQEFCDLNFCRCHNSYIVNLDYVELIKSKEIILLNGENLPISKYKRNSLIQQYRKYYQKYDSVYN